MLGVQQVLMGMADFKKPNIKNLFFLLGKKDSLYGTV
jgi:hypothetical protein